MKDPIDGAPSLYEALRTVRSRRVGYGYRVDSGQTERHPVTGRLMYQAGGPRRFVSEREPLALTLEEEALLAWAGCGPNGLITWEASIGGGFEQLSILSGRTAPEANNTYATDLVIINDDGAFLYRPRPEAAGPVLLSDQPADWLPEIVSWYESGRTRISNSRPDVDWAMREPAAPNAMLNGSHQYNLNRPGATWFIPVTDAGLLQSGIIDSLFRQRTGFFDDLRGEPIPAFADLRREGMLERMIALSAYEQSVLVTSAYPAGAIVQNIRLASESLGLGTWSLSGYSSDILFGLRPDLAKGLGFDGYGCGDVKRLTCVPSPSFPDGTSVVRAWREDRYGEDGWAHAGSATLTGAASPFRPDVGRALAEHPEVVPADWAWTAAAEYIDCCVERHQRWPVTYSPLLAGFSVIVHHVDTDYYDRYHRDGFIPDRIRHHEAKWH